MLTDRQQRFLTQRRQLLRLWPMVFPLALALYAVAAGWLYLRSPLLFNPFLVADRLAADALALPTQRLMVLLLPFMAILCLFLLLAIILHTHSALTRERQLLAMIAQLQRDSAE